MELVNVLLHSLDDGTLNQNMRLLNSGDDYAGAGNGVASKESQLYNSLSFNAVIFAVLIVLFEANRHIKLIYLKRVNAKFIREQRVPPVPLRFPFAWIVEVMKISDDNLLSMVGLDGYMFLRYISICFRCSLVILFWGLAALAPIYKNYGTSHSGWSQYTLANLPDNPGEAAYWAPAIFAYVFSAYFCYLMFSEYKRFVKKRVDYLINGDPDTPPQTYYTLMLEKIPSSLRSEPSLHKFFNNIFPGDVYSVEVALDLNELDELTQQRREARDSLEKAIAISFATGSKPKVWVNKSEKSYIDSIENKFSSQLADLLGFVVVDSIEYHTLLLHALNEKVSQMQEAFTAQRMRLDSDIPEDHRTRESTINIEDTVMRGRFEKAALGTLEAIKSKWSSKSENLSSNSSSKPNQSSPTNSTHIHQPSQELHSEFSTHATVLVTTASAGSEGVEPSLTISLAEGNSPGTPSISSVHDHLEEKDAGSGFRAVGAKFVTVAGSGVEELAKEGFKTARIATKGALRGVLEATRALELLTLGAYYKTSTTAFVTLNSRVANSSAHQMLLSHKYFTLEINAAPNPRDLIWENVSIPKKQLNLRHSIADATLIIGALFWSGVVTFLTLIGNLNSIAQEFPALLAYSNSTFFQILNSYLVSGLLLILLSILPFIFDFIARNYEGLKLESEIQNSIMTRYFYYQLANVFVSVGLGSLATNITDIINQPARILSILGNSLPNLSFYFTTLVITKTFTALPLELLRAGPLIQILSVMLCLDKKKCTRRELTTGAFADPPMLYGWCYPNIMMVLMIMLTYATIAPMILPFCLIFFAFTYLMYKYQLLYVYVTEYQSGGFMWYAVFSRSMVCLIWAIVTLICYLAIRETFYTGPFFLLLPLPFAIILFWYQCDLMFKNPSLRLSLESAIELDKAATDRREKGKKTAHNTFRATRFRQPSLAEKSLSPMPYRSPRASEDTFSPMYSHSMGDRSRANSTVEDELVEQGLSRRSLSNLVGRGFGIAPVSSDHRESLTKQTSYVDYYVDNFEEIASLEKSREDQAYRDVSELLDHYDDGSHSKTEGHALSEHPLSTGQSTSSHLADILLKHTGTTKKENVPLAVEVRMQHPSYGSTQEANKV